MIEGRVQADGTLEVGPHTARPEVIRQLLVLSIGLASLGTLAGGFLAIDELTPGNTPLFQAAQGQIGARTDVSLLAAGVSPAELAQVDDTLAVVVTDPVQAVITRTPVGKIQRLEQVVSTVSTIVTPTTITTPTTPATPATLAPTKAAAVATSTTTTTTVTTVTSVPVSDGGSGATTTTVPATTATTVQARGYTVDEVKAIITEVFGPADAANAIAVANCESHLNPRAISKGGGNWGLFQINQVHKQRVNRMGYAWDDLLDPRVNSIVAKAIFDGSGWSPWACRP
jgi:hypothetical protein